MAVLLAVRRGKLRPITRNSHNLCERDQVHPGVAELIAGLICCKGADERVARTQRRRAGCCHCCLVPVPADRVCPLGKRLTALKAVCQALSVESRTDFLDHEEIKPPTAIQCSVNSVGQDIDQGKRWPGQTAQPAFIEHIPLTLQALGARTPKPDCDTT